MESILESLECPITLNIIEDPVQLPCCGKSVSRIPLKDALTRNKICPLCRQDLTNFDIDRAPTNRTLSDVVESFKNSESNKDIKERLKLSPKRDKAPQEGYDPRGKDPPQISSSNQGYPPQQNQYPPQNNQYPPQSNNYPPQYNNYPPQNNNYPPQNNNYPPQGQYPPQNNNYPPQNYKYPPQGLTVIVTFSYASCIYSLTSANLRVFIMQKYGFSLIHDRFFPIFYIFALIF